MQYDSVSKRQSVQYPTSSEEPWKMRMEKKKPKPKQNKKNNKNPIRDTLTENIM